MKIGRKETAWVERDGIMSHLQAVKFVVEGALQRCSVLILKKLGSELFEELLEVVNYLGKVEGMRIIVEPQEYEALVRITSPFSYPPPQG
jgi:hypothetical protein